MKRILTIFYHFIGYMLDTIMPKPPMPEGARINENGQLALRNMEDMGFVDYHCFLQLASDTPEAYMVAGEILGIKSSEVLPYLEGKRVAADKFLPLLRKGLKDFYKEQNG